MEKVGFEPTMFLRTTDLQSVTFNRSVTSPLLLNYIHQKTINYF